MATSDGTMNSAANRDIGPSRCIPAPVGAAVVVLYLLTFNYWAQLLHFNLSFVVQRVCFMAVVLPILMYGQGVRLADLIGRLDFPGRTHPKFVALTLIAALLLRLGLKLAAQSMVHGADMRTLTAWNFFYECIIPPLNEEPMFRGLVLTSLLSIFRPRRGLPVVLAALIFCSIHSVHDPEQQIGALLLGCLLGVVFVRTRSLSNCMVLHAVWNVMIFVPLPG